VENFSPWLETLPNPQNPDPQSREEYIVRPEILKLNLGIKFPENIKRPSISFIKQRHPKKFIQGGRFKTMSLRLKNPTKFRVTGTI